MPKRENELLINDIIESFEEIIEFTKDADFNSFISNKMMANAVIRSFEVIGEASKLLTEEFKSNNPQVEWRRLTDFRNILIHHYFGIDYDTLWDIIQNQVQEHLDFLETIVF